MSATEICTKNTPVEIGPGMIDSAPQPLNEVRYNSHESSLLNTALSSTQIVSDTPRNNEAAGASIAPAGTEMELPVQHLHASKPTHTNHKRSESGSSAEEGPPTYPDEAIGGGGVVLRGPSGNGINDMVGLNEADAALLISPMISRTQSATFYDQQRSGSATIIPQPTMQEVEDCEEDTPGGSRSPPRVVVHSASSMPIDPIRKDQKVGVLSSTAHRLSSLSGTISGLHLTSRSTAGRHSPPEGASGTSTPKNAGKRSSMFAFTLPSFHLPQMPSAPSFLTEITTRRRSKSNVLGNPFSKTSNQSPRTSLFFGKPAPIDRDIAPHEQVLQRPQLSSLRRSSSHPSLLSYSSSFDEAHFSNVQSMTNARLKALKDNFRGLSAGNTIANAANALSVYANSLNTALSSSPLSSSETTIVPPPFPVKPHPLDTVEGDIVVMGGYRGSILREASGQKRRVWIPLRVGLNLRKVNLEIGLNDEDEETMSERIIADGMLTHIGPVDIGRRLLRRLRTGQGHPGVDGKKFGRWVYEYGYDWRLSPHILSRQLIEYLEQLPCNRGNGPGEPRKPGRGALIIAHSLGGLIVRHAMNQRPELFSGVLFAGTPQHCVNILGPLRNGDTVLLSSRVLNAQVNFTLRSSYALLPESGHCFVDKNTGEKYPMDFFDVNTWIRNALSPCVVAPSAKKSLTPPSTTSATNQGNQGSGNGIGETVKDAAKEGMNAATKDRTLAPQMDSTSTTLNPFSQIPSFLEDRVCTLPISETIPYLDRTLKQIKQFKEQLKFNPEIGYPLEEKNEEEGSAAIATSESPDTVISNSGIESDENTISEVAGIGPSNGIINTAADAVTPTTRFSVHYPPMAILYANNTPTVKGARVDGVEGILQDNVYDDLIFGAGDGVCLAKAAQLPPGYKACARVLCDRGHISLLGDLDSVGKAIEAIVRERGW